MATGKIQRIATSVGALTIATLIGGTISLASNVLMAKFFGAGHLTDAFFMAYAIPLLFAKVFQAGPMPKVFLSLFVREVETQERESAWRAASNIFNVFAVFFVAIVGLLVLCAPWLVGVLAAGYESATFAETVTLARVVIPVLGLLTLSALLTAALQSLDEFVRPALFSLALPSTFLVAIVLGYYTGMGIIALPLGLLAGNVIQLGGLYWCLAHKGFRHAWVFDWRDPLLRDLLVRLSPFLVSGVVVQVQVFTHRFLSSFLPEGSFSALSYAERIHYFLTNLLVVGFASVLFPTLARQFVHDEEHRLRHTLKRGLNVLHLVCWPAACGLILVRRPLIAVLFQRGAFDAADVAQTSMVLGLLAIGLFGMGATVLFHRTFFALEATGLLVRANILISSTVILFNFTFAWAFGLAGLGLSWGLAPLVAATCYSYFLHRRLPGIGWSIFSPSSVRIGLATAGMTLVSLTTLVMAQQWVGDQGFAANLATLALVVVAGVVSYAAGVALLNVEEAQLAWTELRRRVSRPAPVVQPVTPGVDLEPVDLS